MINCFECGAPLPPQDIEDGEIRCFGCDEKLIIRFKNWQQGQKDPELDLMAMTKGLIH